MSSVDNNTVFFSLSPSDSSVHTSEGSPAVGSHGRFNTGGSLQLSDEDLLFDDSFSSNAVEPSSGKAKKSGARGASKRQPNNTAERKEIHNKIERQRRENLNTKFLDLAAQLPNMAGVKRTSKSVIVHKSLAFIGDTLVREAHLTKQNEVLFAEVQALRARLGLSPRQALVPLPAYTTGMPVMQSVTTASLQRSDSISSQGSAYNNFLSSSAATSEPMTVSAPIDLSSSSMSASWTSQSSFMSSAPVAAAAPTTGDFQKTASLPVQPVMTNPLTAYANADFSSIFQSILGTAAAPTTEQIRAPTESYPPLTGFEFAGIPAPNFSFGGNHGGSLGFHKPSTAALYASA